MLSWLAFKYKTGGGGGGSWGNLHYLKYTSVPQTHISHTKHIGHALFNVSSTHTMFQLHRTTSKNNANVQLLHNYHTFKNTS